jgi:UDPglucose 6-dehydrogenase
MKIAIIGTGYVGLVTGTCLAESGNQVVCVDIDAAKIARLTRGEIPIYEPGLAELVERNLRAGRLSFTTDTGAAAGASEVVFLAVGTPPGEDGAADLRHLFAAAETVARGITGSTLLVTKSTVPVGTARRLLSLVHQRAEHPCEVVSNPEFLKEGAAIEDFMKPDRVVVGCQSERARAVMGALYRPFTSPDRPVVFMDLESAEMTKYVANAFLATKISFINEMARLCQATGADIEVVRRGIGLDRRIGPAFLNAGLGYGGSCFPKDIRALVNLASHRGVDLSILRAVERVNEAQKLSLVDVLRRILPDARGRRVALWGLAFKPETDDIREAPAIHMATDLLSLGYQVQATDPAAMANTRAIFGDRIAYSDDPYAVVEGADALIIATEWSHYRAADLARVRGLMRRPLVLDGRNLYDPETMRELGFEYHSIGRRPALREEARVIGAPQAQPEPAGASPLPLSLSA